MVCDMIPDQTTLEDIPFLSMVGEHEKAKAIADEHGVKLCDVCEGEGFLLPKDTINLYIENEECNDEERKECDCCNGLGYYAEDHISS